MFTSNKLLLSMAISMAISGCASTDNTASTTQVPEITAPVCPAWQGEAVSVAVNGHFAEGELVSDYYSGATSVVKDGQVTMTPAKESGGILLLEKAEHKAGAFTWDNATVYFVIPDRFYNGNTSNDNSYGRKKDGMDEIGTFHGGDIAGLTQKLDYLDNLGINAIWITPPVEQTHGWTGGGIRGDFPHYGYHGYYAQDFTKIDANMGTEKEFKAFVDAAHERGIRVIMDVVINHIGYATLADMQEYKFGALKNPDTAEKFLGKNWSDWTPKDGQSWHDFNRSIDYSDAKAWQQWWGPKWIRTDIVGHDKPGKNDITTSLAYLPDLKTETKEDVGLPVFYKNKSDTNAVEIPGATVRQYQAKWFGDWVRKYGIDGFRVDTVKHVELESLDSLKKAGSEAFAEWKANNPDKVLDNSPFWMTGEFWGHGVKKTNMYSHGFDSMINFQFQKESKKGLQCMSNMEELYSSYALKINNDQDFNVVSYISSHDTPLFFNKIGSKEIKNQKTAAAMLLFVPGAAQIYYGDESARPQGPNGSDKDQGTRSDMNWEQLAQPENAALQAHWSKIAQFRKRHQAIGAGEHKQLTGGTYAFGRKTADDVAVVVFAGK